MNIITTGINHKNTPIEIREKFFLNSAQQDLLLSELKNDPAISAACVLSTCNRVEIYAYVIDVNMDLDPIVKLIFRIKNVPFSKELRQYFYDYRGREAIRHLLEVSAGLDSLILGEEQILGQVKMAFNRASELGMFDRYLNILSNIAVRTGKKARHETKINFGGSSVSWAAIVKAEEILGNLKECSVLMIGAGKMSELAVGHIQNKQFKKFYVMNRTQDNARSLATKYGGAVVAFCDMKEILSQVDVCICSAGAPHYLLEKNVIERIMLLRENKQLLFIDISMPRNIDPRVGEVEHVLLYQIDDLKEVVNTNMQVRQNAIKDVNSIIDSKIAEYEEKLRKLPQIPEFIPHGSLDASDHTA